MEFCSLVLYISSRDFQSLSENLDILRWKLSFLYLCDPRASPVPLIWSSSISFRLIYLLFDFYTAKLSNFKAGAKDEAFDSFSISWTFKDIFSDSELLLVSPKVASTDNTRLNPPKSFLFSGYFYVDTPRKPGVLDPADNAVALVAVSYRRRSYRWFTSGELTFMLIPPLFLSFFKDFEELVLCKLIVLTFFND